MNYLLAKSHFVSSLFPRPKNNNSLKKTSNISARFFHFLLGVCSAAIALPLITLAIACSVFFPQEKWEEFWDKFLEA